MTDKDRIAALEREVAALKAKAESPPKSTFVPISDAEWRDQMHQLAEKRMSMAMPPAVAQELNVLDDNLCAGIRQDRHAPTSARGMIPSSQQRADVRENSSTPGYSDPRPLSPPPGVAQADRLMDAQDARDRIELAQRIAAHEAAMRAAQKGKG
jgi:hypothetical protein